VSIPLSSRLTPFYKFVLPTLILAGMCFGAVMAYVHPESMNGPDGWTRDYAWALMLGFGVLMAGVVWWFAGRLVSVELDDDELVISNYRAEIRVMLSNLEAISGPTITNPPRYTLTFVEATEFGRKVTFMPPQDLTFRRQAEARAIGTLKEAWAAARAKR
jgi:hypothetical protein